jgi:hypothetical protein
MMGPAQRAVNRRRFLTAAGLTGGAVLAGCGAAATGGKGSAAMKEPGEEGEEEVSPGEDLMREHGVLERVLLVYGEGARRLEADQDVPPEPLTGARLVRRFIEDHREQLEENFLFPRFEKVGLLVDLVAVLRAQHQAGRRVTDEIEQLAGKIGAEGQARPAAALRSFARMYRPHAAPYCSCTLPG